MTSEASARRPLLPESAVTDGRVPLFAPPPTSVSEDEDLQNIRASMERLLHEDGDLMGGAQEVSAGDFNGNPPEGRELFSRLAAEIDQDNNNMAVDEEEEEEEDEDGDEEEEEDGSNGSPADEDHSNNSQLNEEWHSGELRPHSRCLGPCFTAAG